jgi:hypothetical protein
MDSKTIKLLENFVREVVRDEISKNLKSSSKKVEKIDEVKLSKLIGSAKKTKAEEPINTFSTNPLLNSVLEETAQKMKPHELINEDISYSQNDEIESWPEMKQKPMVRQSMRPMVVPDGMSAEHIPEPVQKALTKDYSALMRKIKEKKGK